LVVVASLGNVNVVGIVRVVVVTSVIGIGGVESFDSERSDDVRLSDRKSVERVLRSEEFGSDGHSDWEVASELVVGARTRRRGTVDVLVDSTTTDQGSVDLVLRILGGI
jgi:hypothetical protein